MADDDFVPSWDDILGLAELGLVEINESGQVRLTEQGLHLARDHADELQRLAMGLDPFVNDRPD